MTTVVEEIERIKSMDTKLNESTAKTAFVMPMLRALGWDTTNPDEVHMEYRVATHLKGYADIALLAHDVPLILIETKAPHGSLEIEKNKIQVLEYCRMKQVQIGVLTNGLEWRIYYLGAGADESSALAEIINLVHRTTEDSAKVLGRLLSKDAFGLNKGAHTNVKQAWYNRILSNLWKSLLARGDKSLVMLLGKEAKKRQIYIPPNDVKKFIVARSTLLDTVDEPPISPVAPPQDKQEVIPPAPKPGKLFHVRVRIFGVESEFKSLRETLINFALQACHQNEAELGNLARCLEADGRKLIMVYSDEQPPTLRSPRRIGETNYWLETHFSKANIKKACNRIKLALSLPEDVLIWLD